MSSDKFRVWPEEATEDDGDNVEALDAAHAAEIYERDADLGDYAVADGSTEVLCIRCPGGAVRRFEMSGTMIVEYRAEEL